MLTYRCISFAFVHIYALRNLVYMHVSVEHPVKYVTANLKLYTLPTDWVGGWGEWEGGYKY